MTFYDPYAVDGAEIRAAQIRQHLYATSKGETGVLTPESLKVVGIAGSPGVLGIMPGVGSVAVESRREAYQVTNTAMDGDALIEVPPAGSSGATHYAVVDVIDPEYEGEEGEVRPRLVSSLTGSTPRLVLAEFSLPAGAGFDATTPITDLRRVVMQREWRRLFTRNLTGSDVHALQETGAGGEYWPDTDDNQWQVDVPEWATHVNVKVTYGGVRVSYSGARGAWWVRIGRPDGYGPNIRTQDQVWSLDTSVEPGREVRETWSMGDDLTVPAELRGTRQPVRVIGRVINTGGPPRLDNASSIMVDVQFTEGPA